MASEISSTQNEKRSGQMIYDHEKPYVCTKCSCLCDDLQWRQDEGFDQSQCHRLNEKSIDIQINNLIYNEIIENAMKLINDAISYNRRIAFTGLEYLSFESQKLAIEMARRINAWIISNEKGTSADPWDITFSQMGGWHASWSEIRLRSDSILLWYAPLWETHPRWVERFGPRLHNAHRLAVIDPGVELIDNLWFEEQVIRLNSEGSIAFLTDLRLALKNKSDNHPNGDIRHLIHHFNNSHWLSIVKSEDPPLISDKLAYANTMIRLVMESNRLDHRVVLNSVSRAPNTQGMSAIQSWRAGLHMPIWFSPEGPVFRPDELKLDEFDLMISFGFNKPLSFRGKLIWMNPQGNEINQFDDFIEMPVSNIGLDSGGTLIRQDGVAIYAGKSRESSRLNVSDFITSFLNSVIAEPNFRSRRS